METRSEQRLGVAYGLAAYISWGFFAVYFKLTAHVPPLEVLAHRIIWSVALLSLFLAVKNKGSEIRRVFGDARTFRVLALTALLISCNWLVFIWAIASGHILQASLGYFINPLVNVLLGVVFLKERLRRLQVVSVAIAAIGVLLMTVMAGKVPVISLVLAFTFGVYGLLRKRVDADGALGLNAETMILLPLALGYLAFCAHRGDLVFTKLDLRTDLLLLAAGPLTALPLIWFVNAARRLRYSTVGFLQYIAPSLQFLFAVAVYHEPFTRAHALSFPLIWLALALFSWDTFRTRY